MIKNMNGVTSFVTLVMMLLLLMLQLPNGVWSFGVLRANFRSPRQNTDFNWRLQMFFAEESAPDEVKNMASPSDDTADGNVTVEESPPPVQLVISDSESFLNAAGSFLVDSFWLGSDHHMLKENDVMTADARMNLVIEQAADLQEKYGETMGKRLANCCVVGALDEETKELIGLVTLKETLLVNNNVLESEKAESIAKNAVAALGPKQRREYKNAPIRKIADQLLSPETKAICVMSNLAVSEKARRRGVARTLCQEVEALAGDWGFSEAHLIVESQNTAARTLYEKKLGYKPVFTNNGATGLRIDFETGEFLEVTLDTLIMKKKF